MQEQKKTFEKILAWELSHNFVKEVYLVTAAFPKEEVYGLVSQLRRAVVSIPCNIVEGRARGSSKEFVRFLLMARGSLEEVEYLLIASRDLGFLSSEKYQKLDQSLGRVGAVLNGLIRSLRS